MKYEGVVWPSNVWHVVQDGRETYYVARSTYSGLPSTDGYHVFREGGGDIKDDELRRRIIATCWPMIGEGK